MLLISTILPILSQLSARLVLIQEKYSTHSLETVTVHLLVIWTQFRLLVLHANTVALLVTLITPIQFV